MQELRWIAEKDKSFQRKAPASCSNELGGNSKFLSAMRSLAVNFCKVCGF